MWVWLRFIGPLSGCGGESSLMSVRHAPGYFGDGGCRRSCPTPFRAQLLSQGLGRPIKGKIHWSAQGRISPLVSCEMPWISSLSEPPFWFLLTISLTSTPLTVLYMSTEEENPGESWPLQGGFRTPLASPPPLATADWTEQGESDRLLVYRNLRWAEDQVIDPSVLTMNTSSTPHDESLEPYSCPTDTRGTEYSPCHNTLDSQDDLRYGLDALIGTQVQSCPI